MKTQLKVVHAVAAVALAGCCAPSHHSSRAWEYRVVQGWSAGGAQAEEDRAALERQLNEAGGQGYVVVSSAVVPGDAAGNKAKTIVILKRPKQ